MKQILEESIFNCFVLSEQCRRNALHDPRILNYSTTGTTYEPAEWNCISKTGNFHINHPGASSAGRIIDLIEDDGSVNTNMRPRGVRESILKTGHLIRSYITRRSRESGDLRWRLPPPPCPIYRLYVFSFRFVSVLYLPTGLFGFHAMSPSDEITYINDDVYCE